MSYEKCSQKNNMKNINHSNEKINNEIINIVITSNNNVTINNNNVIYRTLIVDPLF